MDSKTFKKILICFVLVVAALCSYFFISDWAASMERNQATMDSIDRKAQTVLRLTASSTLASAVISAIPGDTATPIAEKLADFTGYFLIILSVLYAEKYLLALVAAGVFKILIPVACVIGMIWVWRRSAVASRLAVKIVLVAAALFVTIPLSIGISDMIDSRYNEVVAETVEESENFSEGGGILEGGESLTQKASRILNRYVESAAVMLVTSCLIPMLVLLFFIWLIKTVTGIDLSERLPHWHKRKQLPENL